jgi:hypothetical protein
MPDKGRRKSLPRLGHKLHKFGRLGRLEIAAKVRELLLDSWLAARRHRLQPVEVSGDEVRHLRHVILRSEKLEKRRTAAGQRVGGALRRRRRGRGAETGRGTGTISGMLVVGTGKGDIGLLCREELHHSLQQKEKFSGAVLKFSIKQQ